MHPILVALLACSFALSAASVAQAAKASHVAMAKRSQSGHHSALASPASHTRGHRHANGLGGIHPLVGSGDY
ncbi:hypothetical protein [Rhodoblastus sp.]|uniref:hypothetical protein n=1 Tax=Rhodoblastus sp. TaxID=1962975 RepID=UPI0035AF2AFD